ncbi:MAG: hypothetical protein NTX64_03625 [Elusimicrobia bacterium]|nr:hypothetical protein [Elusimicrobiota bacterium]
MANIPEVPLETWKRLYSEAERFSRSKPWQRLDESLFFGVQDPAMGQMGYACILGSLGDFLALCVYRGAEAFQVYQDLLREEPSPDDDSGFKQDCLMAQFTDTEFVEKADRKVIRALGLQFKGPKAWPLFRSYRPGHLPWHLDEPEAVFLTLALHCACDWVEKLSTGILAPKEHPGQVFSYVPRSEESAGEKAFQETWTPQPASVARQAPVLDTTRLAKLQSQPLRKGGVWEAEIVFLPATIMDRDRPYHVRLTMLVDRDSGFVLPGKVVPPEVPAHQVLADALAEAAEETHTLPGEIVVRDKSTLPALEAIGKVLGIRIGVGRLRALPQAKKALLQRFSERRL